MKWIMSSAVLVVVALSLTLGAQSGGTMAKDGTMGKMDNGTKTYAGCIEAGNQVGQFVLTHMTADDEMGQDATKKDAMKKDAMGKDNMAHDTMMLTGTSVDLSKHVGHKVTVTGSSASDKMDAMGKGRSAFTVKSLKMVAASCS